MTLDSDDDLKKLKRIGGIVAACLQHMAAALEPGMTTAELDAIGARFLKTHGARSAPQLSYNFPGATCISINNEVAHGIPGARIIKRGDLVNIDVSAELDGYFGDTGGSFPVPPVSARVRRLCDATRQARDTAIAAARDGAPINIIGKLIEATAKATGHTIIRNLGSHGVGRALHEEPEFIAPYHDRRDKRILRAGMVITVEPFLSTGATEADEAEDGWTLFTNPRYLSAQYEHTIVITTGAPLILT